MGSVNVRLLGSKSVRFYPQIVHAKGPGLAVALRGGWVGFGAEPQMMLLGFCIFETDSSAVQAGPKMCFTSKDDEII